MGTTRTGRARWTRAGRAGRAGRPRAGWAGGASVLRRRVDAGMTTAEYAVGTLAACAFAAVLLAIVRSGAVKSALTAVITTALSVAG